LPDAAANSAIMREWARGALTTDDAFVQLYEAYGPLVLTWLRVRVDDASAEDLFQDVWTIFCRRWREWDPTRLRQGYGGQDAGADAEDARPVLSFLFRTCHLVLIAHRRIARQRDTRPLYAAAAVTVDGSMHLVSRLQLGECLAAAKASCTDEEVAVLTAKLAGVPAREIAQTLQVTEAAVDHRFRNAVARIRARLAPEKRGTR
jgi:DNA-directed RNA polymerase specialized sigma24 family protein